MMNSYAYTRIMKKDVDSRPPTGLISCLKATFMRVRLGSQRALITPFRQISGFDLVRIQALVPALLAIW